MKRIIGLVLSLLLLFPTVTMASGAFWPEGWSNIQKLGEYHRILGPVQKIQKGQYVYLLSAEESNTEIDFYLVTYSLSDGEVVDNQFMFTTERGISKVKFNQYNEEFSVIYVDSNNNLTEKVFKQDTEDINKKILYTGRRGIDSPYVFTLDGIKYYLWSEVYGGSTNILMGFQKNGIFTKTDGVFLGDEVLNRVEDVIVIDNIAYISWVADESRRGSAGVVKSYVTTFNGEIIETKLVDEYVGETSGQPRFVVHDDQLHLYYEYMSSASLGGRKSYELIIRNLNTNETNSIILPTKTGIHFAHGTRDIFEFASIIEVYDSGATPLELFHYTFDPNEGGLSSKRLTYSSRSFTDPTIFQYDGYNFIFFEEGLVNAKSVLTINDRFQGKPSVWRQLGLDEQHPITSTIYYFISNLFMAVFYTVNSILFLCVVWGLFAVLRRFGLLSKANENWRSNIIQCVFACLISTQAISYLFPHQFFTGFQIYAAVLSTILIIFTIGYSNLKHEEFALPLAIGGYSIIYLMIILSANITSFIR